MDDLTREQWPRTPPPPPRRPRGPVVNRWGDTAEDQRRRREDLVSAMAEYDRESA